MPDLPPTAEPANLPTAAAPQPLPSKHDYHREWRHLYQDTRWRHPVRGLRMRILMRDVICKMCNKKPATVVDHVVDHRGDAKLFFDPNNVQGVCKPCHDAKTGSMHGADRGDNRPHLQGGAIRDYGLTDAMK